MLQTSCRMCLGASESTRSGAPARQQRWGLGGQARAARFRSSLYGTLSLSAPRERVHC